MIYSISSTVRALIFDFDGTIVDSMPIHFLSWREAFSSLGAVFDEKFFYENAGVSLVGVVETYNRHNGTALSPQEVVARKDAAHLKYLPHTPIIPQVVDVIKANHGILPMAIATGNSRNLTEPLISSLGLQRYFNAIVYGEDVENPKPHPDCFLKAASMLEVEPSWCEVFEDGDAGIEGAKRAGMKATDIRPWLVQSH